MTESNIKVMIQCDIHKVWETVLAARSYHTWRSDVSKTEVIDEKRFTEYTKDGYSTAFTVTVVEPHRCWEVDVENVHIKGHWTLVFTSKGSETESDFTACVTAKQLTLRPIGKSVFEKGADTICNRFKEITRLLITSLLSVELSQKSEFERKIVAMIALNRFKKILEENEERFSLLTLDEFFEGNTEEDSIAPNQWEEGRPSLAEIWDMLRKIELLPDIAWVRVILHDDTQIEEDDGNEVLILEGDSIVLCTNMQPSQLEKIVNFEWLCSDGVIEIKPSELDIYSCIPSIPEGFNCLEIVWD